MKTVATLIVCGALGSGMAWGDDAEGCKDSPLITRMPGAEIHSCEHKEFDALKVVTGNKDGNDIEKTIEGEYWSWDYGTREGSSELQIFRNIQNALRAAGMTIDYAVSPSLITAHKGKTWFKLENSGTYYYQFILEEKPMQQEVTADASQLKNEIENTGRVSIYGIHFDTGKAAILPDSEQSLNEIVKLLEADANLKLRVEGHTDNVGQSTANQLLSLKRAQAVVGWLVAHGIDASRLAAKGFGDTKPVADNATDEGKAKNRRVDLVKM